MVIFLGWSHSGKACAAALKNFLLTCFPTHVDVSVSVDIRPGGNWRAELLQQLKNADYGIMCITRDSDSAWMCYESGVLAAQEKPTAPLLFDDVSSNQIFSPLSSSQAVRFDETNMRVLTDALYRLSGMKDWGLYEKAFPAAWEALQADIQQAGRTAYRLADFEKDLEELLGGTGELDEWMARNGRYVAAYLKLESVSLRDKAERLEGYMADLKRYEAAQAHFSSLRRKLESLVI